MSVPQVSPAELAVDGFLSDNAHVCPDPWTLVEARTWYLCRSRFDNQLFLGSTPSRRRRDILATIVEVVE